MRHRKNNGDYQKKATIKNKYCKTPIVQGYSALVVFSCMPDRGLCFGANPPKRAKFHSFYLASSLFARKEKHLAEKSLVTQRRPQ